MHSISCSWDNTHEGLEASLLSLWTGAPAKQVSRARFPNHTPWVHFLFPMWGRPALGAAQGDRDDPGLVQAVQRGDQSAVSRVLDDCLPLLRRRLAKRYRLSPDDLEDVLQEVRLAFLDAAPRFRGTCQLSTYLTQIACRKCIDLLRARARQAEELYPRDESRIAGDRGNLEENVADRVVLEEALAQLSPRQRQVVVMYHCDGRSYAEIAQELDIAIGTVAATKAEALQRLRSLLTDAGVSSAGNTG